MKKVYGYALAAGALLLASCSSDAPETPKQPLDGEAIGYIKLNLPESTRAAGDTKVIFYKNGAVVNSELDPVGNGVYAVAAVPDRVVAFLDDNSLEDNRSKTTTNMDGKSPAVFGNNTYGSSVSQANIFHKASDASTAAPVVVYVEPVVAKATVELAGNIVNDMSGNKFNGYTIKFVPEYVFVNGVSTKTPMIKTMPTSGKTNLDVDFNDPALSWEDATGKGSSWTTTDYAWNTPDVRHYAISGTGAKAPKSTKQEGVLFFERAKQAKSDIKKDFTHIIVAGRYELADKDGNAPTPFDGWDGTFYVYGANAEGLGTVYFTEADVIKAMGGTGADGEKLTKVQTTTGGQSTHMKFGTEICVKYDKGYVYYAEPIVTTVKGKTVGKGVVRNHEYKITVSQIKGWGTAIPDTDEPIIPEDPKDPEQSFIKLNIVVNPYVKVAPQDVKW